MSEPILRSLGLHSDLLVMRGHAEVETHPDRVILRTPSEPDFWFGNCVIFKTDQVEPDAQIAAFHDAFPSARHVLLQWDAPDQPLLPGFTNLQKMGFEIDGTDVLTRSDPLPETRPDGITLRPVTSDADWDEVFALQSEIGVEEGYVRDIHDPFLKGRIATRRSQIAEGWGCWFGAYAGDLLVGDLGIFTDGRTARYQSVETRASHRRRGICRALVAAAGNWAKTRTPDAELVILADSDDHASGIYRKIGFTLREQLRAACKPPANAKVDQS